MNSHVTQVATAVAISLLSWAAGSPAANAAAADPGVRPTSTTDTVGNPVPGLTTDQTTMFFTGQESFKEIEAVADGLGPRFNLDSCVGCHAFPTHGGSSPALNPQVALATAFGANNTVPTFLSADGPIREARFKFTANGTRDGGVHSLFVISGRVDASGSAAGCTAVQENFNAQYRNGNVSLRIPTPTYGLGLVENIPDTTLTANLAANRAQKSQLGISGHLNTNDNDGRIARYGWKAQNVSLLLFSGEAYNVEEGITNELFQTERDLTSGCQTDTVPNDVTGKLSPLATGSLNSDITNFAMYMRFLAPPAPATTTPGGATSISNGQRTFSNIGCSLCHTPALKTANTTVAALANQTAAMYSDLALHQMGPGLADNIQQGAAAGDEFRTAPLWGLGQRIFFLHDGRTSDLVQAIEAHASGGSAGNGRGNNQGWNGSQFGPSEANRVIASYNSLNGAQQQDLLNFLRSL